MVRPQMEQIGGEDGWSEEAQENETAHCRVSDILIHYTKKQTWIYAIKCT